MKRMLMPVLLALLAWPALGLAEPATVGKADNLHEKPFVDAKILGRLAAGKAVDIQKREGAWYQVKSGGKLGWVKLLSVRRTPAAAVASSGSLTQVATGRAGTGQIVSTTGVRGLGEETLKEAAFSEAAVAAVETYRVKPAEADKLARAQGLVSRKIPALPTPKVGGGT